MKIDEYLERVFYWSFFSKRERQDRADELRAHLEETVGDFMSRGFNQTDAVETAIQQCGNPSKLRRQLTASAFGISSVWITRIASLFALLFFIFVILTPSIPVFSPSLMLCLAILAIMFSTTRKRKDRWALFIGLAPFCIAYLQSHDRSIFALAEPSTFINQPSILENIFLPSWFLYTSPYFRVVYESFFGLITLYGFGLVLFGWTKNVWSSAVPLIYSIAISVWPVVRDTVKFLLWRTFHDLLFKNPPPLESPNNIILLSVASRLLVLLFVVLTARWFSVRFHRNAMAQAD